MGDHAIIDGPTGTLAIWKGATDLGPFTNPSAHGDRLRFHSRQENMGYWPTPVSGSADVSNWPEGIGADRSRRINLFTHSLSYRPTLKGFVTIDSKRLPIQGSIVHRHSSGVWFSYTIGVDDTYVYLTQLRFLRTNGTPAATTISYTIWLSAYGMAPGGGVRRPPYFNGVDINAGAAFPYVKAGYFDTSAYVYPYQKAAGEIPCIRGASMSIGIGYTGGAGSAPNIVDASGLGWRYAVNGYVAQRNATAVSTTGTGVLPGNNASFVADLVEVSF